MFIRIVLASAVLTCSTVPVFAASQEQASVKVELNGLDLATTKGQEKLNKKITWAAQKICRSGSKGLTARAVEMKCREVVLAKTRPQIDVAIANSLSRVRIATANVSNGS